MKRKILLFMAALLTVGLIGCGGTDQVPEAGTTSTPENKKEEAKEESPKESSDKVFKDSVLQTKDIKISITDYKVIPVGDKGNEYGEKPVIAFWYDTTNVSGSEIDPTSAWITNIKAVQDNNENAVNELNVGSLPDEQFLDTQTEKIKKGGTVSNAVAYELDDEVTPVDLIAYDLLDGDYGTQRYDIAK